MNKKKEILNKLCQKASTKQAVYRTSKDVFEELKVILKDVAEERLNSELRNRGFQVEEVPYAEIAKMEGLLRCSTMPLRRK